MYDTSKLSRHCMLVAATLLSATSLSAGERWQGRFSDWGIATAVTGINSAAADGCPIELPDGLSLYIASTRTGTLRPAMRAQGRATST